MYIERYLSNKTTISVDENGFLIGEPAIVKNEFGITNYDYSLSEYKKINDIIDNPYSIIKGNGGLGKSVFLTQMEDFLKKQNNKYIRINLCSLTTESDLLTKINKFLIQTQQDEKKYILLDAIDEAIDHNIRNPIELLSQVIKNIVSQNTNCHFIITSRSQINNIPALDEQLSKIYQIKEKGKSYIYELCPLTNDDAKMLAKYYEIKDVDKFISEIKNLSLSSFLTTPITFKTIVDLYKNNKINEKTNHFEIYLELITHLLTENSKYRQKQASDNIDKYKIYSSNELLFIISKLAIDLKIMNKTGFSKVKSTDNNYIYIYDYENLNLNTNSNKKYIVEKEILDYILSTRIFYMQDNKYLFCQKTYCDFLCAYYLIEKGISIKIFNKLFCFKGKVFPNYYDILSLISIQKENFFRFFLKKSPEALIFSNIVFNSYIVRYELLKKYINIIKKKALPNYRQNTLFTCRKLYSNNTKKLIENNFKSNDTDIISMSLDYIYINKLSGFEENIKKIILNPKYEISLKIDAIDIIKDTKIYEFLIEFIVKNLQTIKNFMNDDINDNLRGVILETIYPKYINNNDLLSLIVPIDQLSSYGRYRYFINNKFLNDKYINKNNVLFFLKWVLNNDYSGITRDFYNNSFPDHIKCFFVSVAKYIDNKEIIDIIIDYQINSYKITFECFSDYLFNKISENRNRLYALKQYIKYSKDKTNFYFLIGNPLLQSKDIAYLMALYNYEEDINLKEKYKNVINNYSLYYYWDNGEIKDFEFISHVFDRLPHLKEIFTQFNIINCLIDNKTGNPIDNYSIEAKNDYFKQEQRKQERDKRKKEIDKKQQYFGNIEERIKEHITEYKKNKNKSNLIYIFSYLNHKIGSENLYCCNFLDYENTLNWEILNENIKEEIIKIFIEYINECSDLNIPKDYDEENIYFCQPCEWSIIAILPYIKKNQNIKEYEKLLQKHKIAIFYFNVIQEEEKILKKILIKDLFSLEKEYIINNINKLILKDFDFISSYIDIFESFEYVKNDFNIILKDLYQKNKKKLSDNSHIAIIEYLFKQNDSFAINTCFNELKNKSNNIKILTSYLNILLSSYKHSYWAIIKSIFYKNINGVEIFKKIAQFFDYNDYKHCINYTLYNDDELVEFYIWLIKNIPEKQYEGIHEYKPEENISNRIYNFWINNGKYKCITKIKKTFKNKKIYKRSYYLAFYQFINNKLIDLDEFKKFETISKNFFSLINLDYNIIIGKIENSIIGHIGHR